MAGIVWLASYPKSGNTWVRIFLENLLTGSENPIDINGKKYYTIGESSAHWFKLLSDKPITLLDQKAIAQLRPRVHEFFTTTSPGTVLVKTHNALVTHHGVPLITTEHTAGAVYIIRNPLDVVISVANHFGVPIKVAIRQMGSEKTKSPTRAIQVYEYFSSWSRHVYSWTAQENPRLCVVRYEDMLEKPVETFSKIASFVGRDPSPERLNQVIENSSFERSREQEDKKGFIERSLKTEKFFREGRSGQWRERLTRGQIRKILHDHKKEMERYGYVPEGY